MLPHKSPWSWSTVGIDRDAKGPNQSWRSLNLAELHNLTSPSQTVGCEILVLYLDAVLTIWNALEKCTLEIIKKVISKCLHRFSWVGWAGRTAESSRPGVESDLQPFAACLSLCFPVSLHCICLIKPVKGQKIYFKKLLIVLLVCRIIQLYDLY